MVVGDLGIDVDGLDSLQMRVDGLLMDYSDLMMEIDDLLMIIDNMMMDHDDLMMSGIAVDGWDWLKRCVWYWWKLNGC